MFRQIASHLVSQFSKTSSLNGYSENNCKRQIFITVSYSLCCRVKKYFNRLLEAAILARKKMSAEEYDEHKKNRKDMDNNITFEVDAEEKELSGIPDSFNDLEDKDFPLFITYNKFSRMLQGTYGIDVQKLTVQKKHNAEDDDILEGEKVKSRERSSSLNLSNASWHHFIDYNLFQEKYWPRFNDYYRKKLDCELVFSEFSVIKVF